MGVGYWLYDIYSPNPPTMSLLLVPVADLDYTGARVAWTLVNLICLVCAVGWLLGQLRLRSWWTPGFAAFALLYQPVFSNLGQGQSYLALLALLVAAWHGYRRQRRRCWGLPWG